VNKCESVQVDLHGQPEYVFIGGLEIYNGIEYWNTAWMDVTPYLCKSLYVVAFHRLGFEKEDIPGFGVGL